MEQGCKIEKQWNFQLCHGSKNGLTGGGRNADGEASLEMALNYLDRVINRPGVARAVLLPASSLINSFVD